MTASRRIHLLVIALAVASGYGTAIAQTQTARSETIDGIPHVYNPEQPRDGVRRVELQEQWRRGDLDDDVLFGLISRVCVGQDGEVYALDSQLSEVQVYSPDGDYLRSIGGRGEGPGEFGNSQDMFFGLGDRVGVLQAFPGKIVQLEPDGTPLDNFRLPKPAEAGFQLVYYSQANDQRLVLAGSEPSADGGPGVQTAYLRSFDPDGEQLAEFHTEEVYAKFGGMEYEEESFVNFQRRWTAFGDGRVAAALSFDAYALQIWNEDGSLDRVIHRDSYPELQRSRAEKKAFQQLYNGVISWNPRSNFTVSDRHITVSELIARPDGQLWVLSGRGMFDNEDTVAVSYDVYDQQGHFTQRVEVVGDIDPLQDSIYIVGDRVFVVTDSLNSFLSVTGSADEGAAEGEIQPSMLVCYSMSE